MEKLNNLCCLIVIFIVIIGISYTIGYNSNKQQLDINNDNTKDIYYKNKFDSINSEINKRDSIIKQLKKNIKHDTQQAYKDSYNDAVNKFFELTSPNKNE